MALIGFRSPLTYHPWPWSEYTEEQKKMFNVRPGITGWAQVNGRKTVEWNKRIELNGWYDKPAVCLQNGVFYACGTPFSGKTDKNENRKAPIQGLCMLHRGKTNKIQKITSGEALPLILPQTLFYGDEEETNLLLSFLDRFLQSVPVYKMECTICDIAFICFDSCNDVFIHIIAV